MSKENIKDFFKNKITICCLILTAIYLLSGYCKWIEIGLPVFASVVFACMPIQFGFCIFAFLHCFTLSNIGYESTFVGTIIVYCLVLLVRYIIGVKKGKYQIYKPLLIAIAVLYGVSTITSFFFPIYVGGFYYYTYLPIFYCVFAMRKEFNISEIMRYFLLGFVLSCSLSLLCFVLPKYQYSCLDGSRFNGFLNHPNSVYNRGIFVITYYMYLQLKNKFSFWKFCLIYAFASAFILASLSKSGILLLAVFTLFYLIMFIKKDWKKRVIYALAFVVVAAIILGIFHNYVAAIINRYANIKGNPLNSILTGRVDIWKDYWTACIDNPFNFLFGHGIFAKEVFIHAQNITRASHNLFIFFLYRFGIFGIILIGFIVYLFVKNLKPQKPIFAAAMPLILFLLESLVACTFKSYNFCLLLFSLMILFSPIQETETNRSIQATKTNKPNQEKSTKAVENKQNS